MTLRPAPRNDKQRSQAAREQRNRRWLGNHRPDDAIGKVVRKAQIASVCKIIAKGGAIEECIVVVATRRAHAVEPTGGRIM